MNSDADKLVDLVLNNPDARQRLGKALVDDLQREAIQSWWHRARPFMAGASSALVVLLAFLIPSIEEQWSTYKIQTAVDRYAEIGRNLMRDGHYESAEQSFARALELAGTQRLDLLDAQIKARVMRVYEDPNWHGAISDDLHESDFVYLLEIEDAVHHPRDRAATLTAYATFLVGQNRSAEAEQSLQEAIKLDATAAAPHIHLGNLYDDTGRTENAEAEYRRAIALDGREANAHYDLGLLLAATQRPQLAEAEFQAYIAFAPLDAAGPLQLAQALMAQNKPSAALTAAQQALRLDPRSEEAQKLVQSLRAEGDGK
ncbi:MAG: tetratricopeptide repeat protein [Rhodospirillaceae bacterium]|nr:MAG: tetratricopeptide repeat protein [Rhodospirillaceae bacterium]